MESLDVRVRIYANIKDFIRCYQCKKLPRPKTKILKNTNNQVICEKCHQKLLDLSSNSRRIDTLGEELKIPRFIEDEFLNYLLENDLPFECQFTDQGCDQVLMPAEIPEHESKCFYSNMTVFEVKTKQFL